MLKWLLVYCTLLFSIEFCLMGSSVQVYMSELYEDGLHHIMSHEHMLCTAKQPLGVVYAAEGLTRRATWEGWMKRQHYRPRGIRNEKPERR
jgi:hypothetical protein